MEEIFASECEIIMVPAPVGGVRRGELVIIGKLCGVATNAAEAGEEVEILVEGCFDFPKGGGAISLGSPVYWDATAKKVTATAEGKPRIGVAIGAAPREAQIARVRLDGFIA
jgi:predicted RecA/RadA family phage recombinase